MRERRPACEKAEDAPRAQAMTTLTDDDRGSGTGEWHLSEGGVCLDGLWACVSICLATLAACARAAGGPR